MSNTSKANSAYSNAISRVFLGKSKKFNESIYLYTPTFDCDWYWGFGYLGNNNCHYFLSSYQQEFGSKLARDMDMFDALKEDYILCPALQNDNNLWVFCELVKTAYAFKEIAEVYNRGGSHYSNNPCKELLKNKEQYEHINFVLLPALFKEIDKLFITPNTAE
jgi:hypothetical protein